MSTPAAESASAPAKRHGLSAVEKQKSQLDRLLKDPTKAAFIPAPPKEKTIRAAREMMKNVQGSSAGAGSGEFHVYKASRRREYDRLKLMEEETAKEAEIREYETRKRAIDDLAESKTAKNRAKRQKKKERAKKGDPSDSAKGDGTAGSSDAPLKKRRLVNGQELVFRRPGESDSEAEDEPGPQLLPSEPVDDPADVSVDAPNAIVTARVTIHEDD